ncbi:MAG: Verru_Chthon cassette protein A [Verrucomicrobiales bacterium]|nr:Verru_Chthon cassette protein A [Verrucomicrobiales bacterium]
MKIAKHLKSGRFLPKSRKGVALVTVLTVMSLTTILVLTFFSLATSEHRASNTYSNGLQAQQVGEQAVNMVIAQIREATTAGTKIAWASQPGAIRRWDDSGKEENAYKLYSDDLMKTDNWGEFKADFDDAQNWSGQPAHYVDLNEPVIRGTKVYYPIVHPRAADLPQWPKAIGDDDAGVEGFSYNEHSANKLTDGGDFGNKAAAVAGAAGHVAMPVKWIYQLEDGTLGVLSPDNGSGAKGEYSFMPLSSGGNAADEDNRIVARFAFWADDETSKLNINTHAGGLAWDIPKAGGALDMDMGRFQPAQKEWQRYPGHPATTHLGPALAPGILDIVNDRDAMEMLYKVVPRIVGGGSQSGTRYIDTRNKAEENGLIPDNEPLFPSLDDVVMRSDREPHEYPDAQGDPVPADELGEYLERAKFFVTVNSRAPETNMYNLPRVAIWPIYNASYKSGKYKTHLTAFDRLIHYCASMGESGGSAYPRHEYVFKRENADDKHYDYNNIERNKELYSYLDGLMKRNVPGYSGSFSGKYGSGEQEQILTEIFDYIRATNLHDDSLYGEKFDDAYVTENSSKHITYTNSRSSTNKQVGMKGHGQVVPIEIGATRGFGRFYSLASAQVQVISCAEPGDIPLPNNMGARSYANRNNKDPDSSRPIYLNFPPMPKNYPDPTRIGMTEYLSRVQGTSTTAGKGEPVWLFELRLRQPNLFNAAFDQRNWNWQLAYLDDKYFEAIVGSSDGIPPNPGTRGGSPEDWDPVNFKFNQDTLTAWTPPTGSDLGAPDPFTAGETRLKDEEQLVQAMFLFNLFTPSIGWGSINPDMEIAISLTDSSSMRFTPDYGTAKFKPYPEADGVPFLGFAMNDEAGRWVFATNATDTAWGGRRYGGLMPYEFILNGPWTVNRFVYNVINERIEDRGLPPALRIQHPGNPSTYGGRGRFTYLDRGYQLLPEAIALSDPGKSGSADDLAQSYRYDLVTVPFKIGGASVERDGPGGPATDFKPGRVMFTGGQVDFDFHHGGNLSEGSASQSPGGEGSDLLQTVKLTVPDFEIHYQDSQSKDTKAPMVMNRWADSTGNYYINANGGYYNEFDIMSKDSFSFLERNNLGMDPSNILMDEKTRISLDDNRLNIPSDTRSFANGRFAQISVHRRPSPFVISDIVQSIELKHGDARIVAARKTVSPSEVFAPHRFYGTQPMAHSVTNAVGADYSGASIESEYLIRTNLASNNPYNNRAPLPFGVSRSSDVQLYGDFDNGSGLMIDGPYINKPDEGNTHSLKTKYARELQGHWEERRNYGEFPYFNRDWLHESGGPAYFSPNRIVSGPGMFGSLPTGVTTDTPWQTLLFRPDTSGGPGYASHPGARTPPDHLIMDLFWMPVVEPYAISEPLSTGGKVNINCELVPFLHIERNTAIRGVFRSEFMLCVPRAWHADYKHNHGRGRGYHWRDNPYGGQLQGKRLRSTIVDEPTLEQFYDRFSDGSSAFKSATEICEIHLIPEELSARLGGGARGSVGSYTPSLQDMKSGKYWEDHSLVGDNSRERPYTNIQTRITTKSNTFKVHFRAQVLKQARRDSSSEYALWRPEMDSVEAEYRGSSIVERYVNPNSEEIFDFAKSSSGESLDSFYQYRVVNPRRFAP